MAPNGSIKKAPTRAPDDVLKRTRSQNVYELSQDLLDKQIELLERKYGGHARANHAAKVIQRAFRHYSMRQKFATITAMAKAERRLSRRLHGEALDYAWEALDDSSLQAEYAIRTNFAALYREIAETIEGTRTSRVHPVRQHVKQYQQQHHQHQQQLAENQYAAAAAANPYSSQNYGEVESQRRGSDHRHYCPSAQLQEQAKTNSKRIPPQVPRRTCSVLSKSASGSRIPAEGKAAGISANSAGSGNYSPSKGLAHQSSFNEDRRPLNLSEHSASEDSLENAGYTNNLWNDSSNLSQLNNSPLPYLPPAAGLQQTQYVAETKALESLRKRQYRVGLNLFNKRPERGIIYLIQKGFLENSPRAVAKFFVTRKGISKQMIGEYLGNLQNQFNVATLSCFAEEMDFHGLDIDVALRRFQTYFRMPGEAQKIERLMEVFGHRYCQCNREMVARLRSPDTVFILAFAIIMLNTDLHTPSLKDEKRMKLDDFIKNLRGIDDGADIDRDLLVGIYDRVKMTEFKPGADHVTQVLKVQQSIVGKKPNLVLPYRRLVCYCRLYEVADASRRERPGLHQREVFLFNDLLVVTKIFSKKKSTATYSFRQSFLLAGLMVSYFESPYYQFGIRLTQRVDNRILVMFNARNEHDRSKFCEDLREAILEMDEMEAIRIETELDKQRSASRLSRPPLPASGARDKAENRDSGVADVDQAPVVLEEIVKRPREVILRGGDVALKRTTLSNSLLDIHEASDRHQRRGSVGSLDSGMSVSFQSTATNSTVSRDSSPKTGQQPIAGKGRGLQHQPSFLGGIFNKRERKNSRGSDGFVPRTVPHSTDV